MTTSRSPFPLERVLFALAGTITVTSALAAALVSPWFLLPTAMVGLNQWLFAARGVCPAAFLLRRFTGLKGCLR